MQHVQTYSCWITLVRSHMTTSHPHHTTFYHSGELTIKWHDTDNSTKPHWLVGPNKVEVIRQGHDRWISQHWGWTLEPGTYLSSLGQSRHTVGGGHCRPRSLESGSWSRADKDTKWQVFYSPHPPAPGQACNIYDCVAQTGLVSALCWVVCRHTTMLTGHQLSCVSVGVLHTSLESDGSCLALLIQELSRIVCLIFCW